MNILFLILSVLIFNGYLVYRYLKKGSISRSISHTYYELKHKWVFAVYQIIFSLFIIFTFENHFITMAGTFIIFSALAADTKADDDVEFIHIIGATGGIILGMLAMLLMGYWWIPAIFIPFALVFMKIPIKNHTWWIEVVAYHMVILGLILNILN